MSYPIFGDGRDGAIDLNGSPVDGFVLEGTTYRPTREIRATSLTLRRGYELAPAEHVRCCGTFRREFALQALPAGVPASPNGSGAS